MRPVPGQWKKDWCHLVEALVPTTKHRRGRRTPRQERALASPTNALVSLERLADDEIITGSIPLVLDIGFGSSSAVVAMKQAEPDMAILAVDTHTPGSGDLLACIHEQGLTDMRVIGSDVRLVLERLPAGRLSGVRTFFPDPWPKTRHHRRRLVTTAFADALARTVMVGGFWHVATDWSDYAAWIQESVTSSALWSGGSIPRPVSRPETRYEVRGRAAGREPIDLWFERVLP